MKSVILFHSNNYTIWAKSELKKNSIKGKMISVPRNLSSNCGYCLEINSDDENKAEKILNQKNIEFDKIKKLEN